MIDQAWISWSEERDSQIAEVFRRLSEHGITPGPNGYDATTLVAAVEDNRTDTAAFVTEGEQGGFYAWVDEWQALAADAYGWTPVVALARAIDDFLTAEP